MRRLVTPLLLLTLIALSVPVLAGDYRDLVVRADNSLTIAWEIASWTGIYDENDTLVISDYNFKVDFVLKGEMLDNLDRSRVAVLWDFGMENATVTKEGVFNASWTYASGEYLVEAILLFNGKMSSSASAEVALGPEILHAQARAEWIASLQRAALWWWWILPVLFGLGILARLRDSPRMVRILRVAWMFGAAYILSLFVAPWLHGALYDLLARGG